MSSNVSQTATVEATTTRIKTLRARVDAIARDLADMSTEVLNNPLSADTTDECAAATLAALESARAGTGTRPRTNQRTRP